MRIRSGVWLLVLLSSIAPLAVRAESALDHLPEDAVGFVLVRNMQAASAKIEKVAKIFQELVPMPIPAPLQLVKTATGLGAGINEQGDAVLAVLPSSAGLTAPMPLLIVPISDYAAFAGSVSGDASGEVCRVTIAGEEVLVAKRGTYAVLMNVENRDRLEALLSAGPKSPAGLEPLQAWLAKTDFAAVITPPGVKLLTSLGKAGLAGQRAATEAQLSDPQSAELLKQTKQMIQTSEAVLGFLGAEVEAGAFGLAIDDRANLKLMSQVLLTKGGKLADIKRIEPGQESPLTGYADETFVAVAGGPLPPAYGESMAKFFRKMVETYPSSYGFEKFTDKDWEEVEAMWADSMRGLRSMSTILLPGKDEPLLENFYGVIKVDDSAKYMESYAASMKKWNELLARTSSDIKMNYETTPTEIEGKKAILFSTDIAAAAGDENVPDFQNMLKAMVGEDGKSTGYIVAVDETTVVMAMSDEAHAVKAVQRALKKEQGLAESSSVQTAIKLLDKEAPWMGAVSPRGTVAWFSRMYNEMFAQLGGGPTLSIPEFPETPPLGFSLNLDQGRLSGEMAWPVETLRGIAAYAKKCME